MDYKLEFAPCTSLHHIFHVSSLKKVINDKISIQSIFLDLDQDGKMILELEI